MKRSTAEMFAIVTLLLAASVLSAPITPELVSIRQVQVTPEAPADIAAITPVAAIAVASPSTSNVITASGSPGASQSVAPKSSQSVAPKSSQSVAPKSSQSDALKPSVSVSKSAGATATPSTSATASASVSVKPSVSASVSVSATASVSPTASASMSVSPSVSASVSPSVSVSPSPGSSMSSTPSVTPTVSVSMSASPSTSVSASTSISASVSATPTVSPSVGSSKSAEPSPSATSSAVTTSTPAASASSPAIEQFNAEVTPQANAAQSPVCFPHDATVKTENGETKLMAELEIGDRVAVGNSEFSEVFMFTHKLSNVRHEFVAIKTAAGPTIRLTAGHYLPLNGAYQTAGRAKVGDTVALGDGTISLVTEVNAVSGSGLFNPQTLHGDIVVDGVLASTYTTAVERKMAHAMLAPLRTLSNKFGLTTSILDTGADSVARVTSLFA